MYMRKWMLKTLTAFLVDGTANVEACACCAEFGERFNGSTELSDERLHVLRTVKFATQANLVTTSASPDDIKGLTNANVDSFSLKVSVTSTTYSFDLSDGQGRRGQITLPISRKMWVFEVDPKGANSRTGRRASPIQGVAACNISDCWRGRYSRSRVSAQRPSSCTGGETTVQR